MPASSQRIHLKSALKPSGAFMCLSTAGVEGRLRVLVMLLLRRPITVSYAYKKDTKGERHGTPAERLLAEQQRSKAAAANRPHTLFASGPRQRPDGGLPPSADNVRCLCAQLPAALLRPERLISYLASWVIQCQQTCGKRRSDSPSCRA